MECNCCCKVSANLQQYWYFFQIGQPCSSQSNLSWSLQQHKQIIEFSLHSLRCIRAEHTLIDLWFIGNALRAGMRAVDGPWNRPSITWWTSTCWWEWRRSWRTSSWSWRQRCHASSRGPLNSTKQVATHRFTVSVQHNIVCWFGSAGGTKSSVKWRIPTSQPNRETAPRFSVLPHLAVPGHCSLISN